MLFIILSVFIIFCLCLDQPFLHAAALRQKLALRQITLISGHINKQTDVSIAFGVSTHFQKEVSK